MGFNLFALGLSSSKRLDVFWRETACKLKNRLDAMLALLAVVSKLLPAKLLHEPQDLLLSLRREGGELGGEILRSECVHINRQREARTSTVDILASDMWRG
jgi:hypothetical protein